MSNCLKKSNVRYFSRPIDSLISLSNALRDKDPRKRFDEVTSQSKVTRQ
jgi:hypothetical protein